MSIQGTYSDPELIFKLSSFRMPFGKHSTVLLIDLPLPYLNWFSKQGFPEGELGQLMRIVHETKSDGLGHFFDDIRKKYPNHEADSYSNKSPSIGL